MQSFTLRRQLLLAGLLGCTLLLGACDRNTPPSFHGNDVTGASIGKDFRLTDPDGKERTLADFRGKVVAVFFGYTQCPDVCPTALSRAVEVKRLLGKDDAERLQVVFITVDPERDTPEVLKAYTAAFDPTFLGLYGTPERTAETARSFAAMYRKVPTGSSYSMDHTASSYIYDPQGRLRLQLAHALGAQEYAADIRTLLKSR
ncbi:SCO family protein [Massilia sp. G4R7]|uniref:SCO family protein n=1 Tax=Massilia phyllostachyos TaxID=2898585 RepID=A0ABS8Q1G8_9BURK|nr:SCO family protein [Massilia phyllostachyos]MCD2515373.1 SCO family protein [Massilia phyllostachyos]